MFYEGKEGDSPVPQSWNLFKTGLVQSWIKKMSYPSRDWDFDWHGHNAGHDAAVEGADEVEGVVVGVDEGNPVAGFHVHLGRFEPDPVEKGVRDFLRPT